MKRLTGVLAALAAALAYAALLGHLKTLYFLKPFGLAPETFESGWADPLFESWFVIQNLAYFTAVVWLAVQTRRMSLALLATFYALIPLATHYAFLAYDRTWVRFIVDHQHSWLKWIPALLLLWFVVARWRGKGPDPRWRHGRAGWLLLALVAASWGISAAKHLGSHDAERLLRRPEELLPRAVPVWKTAAPVEDRSGLDWRLFRSDPRTVVLVHFEPGDRWKRRTPRVRTVLRTDLQHVETRPETGVQPGGQYF